MSSKKIEHRIFKRGAGFKVPLTKDNAGTGSVEIKHLDFSETSNLVDLNDADVIALRDSSDSNNMKAVKLGAFKSYVSGSKATGRTGSIQFNTGDDFGGAIGLTTDGIHLTASAKLNPGTYVFRLTSGSIKAAGHTYGPVSGHKPQFLEVASSGSERYLFFPSDGTSTTVPTSLNLNLNLDRANSEYRQIRVEAKSGITDWRDVADNFFEQMKLELDTRAGLATVTSSSAGSITATASITISYNSIGGGVAVGGGKMTRDGSPNASDRLKQPPTFTPGADNASDAQVQLANNADASYKNNNSPEANTGVFVQTVTTGSEAIQTALYFTNAALGNSPKHQKIFTDADGNLKVEAANTGSGIVEVRGGKGVKVRTVTNKGFIFGAVGSNPALKDAKDEGSLQRASIQFDIDDNAHPVITFASGATDIISSRVQTDSGSAGTYVFRLTSGSIKAVGHTYGPAASNKPQFLEVFSSGSERYLFFPSDGTSTAKPTANGLQIDTTIGNANAREIRVEAKSGITDWRDVADNFFEQMKLELQTRASIATVSSSSASTISSTASITVAYTSLLGGVAVGGGKVTISGAPRDSDRLVQPISRKSDVAAANASDAQVQLANNAGTSFKNNNSPRSNTGVFVQTISSGSADSFSQHMNLRQAGAKLLFDNGTTYFAGRTTNVQFLTASAAKIDSLEVEEIVSRSTTKNSLEIKDNLVIAAASGSKHANFVGAGFQLGGKVGVQGTGSAPIFSVTLGDPAVNQGSMLFNVSNTRIASVNSGSHYTSAGSVGDGVFAVSGALSASFARAQFVNAGTVTASLGTIHRITTDKLDGKGVVTMNNIGSGSVQTGHIVNLQVTTPKIAVGAAGIDQLATSSVNTPQLVTSGVTKAKIATGAVTLDKLATGSVSTPQLGIGVVTHAKLAVGAVTADNIQTASVNTAHLAATSVTHAKFGIGAVERDNFGSGSVHHGHIAGAILTADSFRTGSLETPHFTDGAVGIDALATGSVSIKQLNQELVRAGNDAHGGLTIGSSQLKISYIRRDFARSDGSNISGSVATKGLFASDAIPTPFTTASLGAQPMSGTLEVYFNGVLLLGDHPKANAGGPTSADYRVITASAGAYKIQLAEDLALDSDDILTVTYYSGSNPA